MTSFMLSSTTASRISSHLTHLRHQMGAPAIGMVLTMDILMGGTLTGASMNPARTLGPAVALGELTYFWMYLVGPFLGGGIAAMLYNMLYLPAPRPAEPVRSG